jgi:hypothetical protein
MRAGIMTQTRLLIGMTEMSIREWLVDHPNDPEAKDFLARRGRFTEMEPSTDDREQIFPGPAPADILQTHALGEYRDAS